MPSESPVAKTQVLAQEQPGNSPALQSTGPEDVAQLRKHLQSLRQQIERVEGWVESSLTSPQSSPLLDAGNGTLSARMDEALACLARLERAINGSRKAEPAEGSVEVTLPVLGAWIQDSHKKLNNRLKEVEGTLATVLTEGRDARSAIEQILHPPQEVVATQEVVDEVPESTPESPTLDLTMLFGRDLVQDSRTADGLTELARRLADEDPPAVGFVGELLCWRSATRERIPKLLGDVGDAYYACFPRTTDQVAPLEQALVDILAKKCIDQDVPNSIELVRLGERFSPSRHRLRAGERGVEVTEICGWVVVGPDGQILNRAQVGVK